MAQALTLPIMRMKDIEGHFRGVQKHLCLHAADERHTWSQVTPSPGQNREVWTQGVQRDTHMMYFVCVGVCVYISQTQRHNSKKGLSERVSKRFQDISCDKRFTLYLYIYKSQQLNVDIRLRSLHALNNIVLKFRKKTDARCHSA